MSAKLTVSQEMQAELKARIASWKAERDQLLKASVRISTLETLIAEAEEHLAEYTSDVASEKLRLGIVEPKADAKSA